MPAAAGTRAGTQAAPGGNGNGERQRAGWQLTQVAVIDTCCLVALYSFISKLR